MFIDEQVDSEEIMASDSEEGNIGGGLDNVNRVVKRDTFRTGTIVEDNDQYENDLTQSMME